MNKRLSVNDMVRIKNTEYIRRDLWGKIGIVKEVSASVSKGILTYLILIEGGEEQSFFSNELEPIK